MNWLRSKKAYTLVELVVTVAILSITATIGVGIFASALRTYSSASVTSKEQQSATEIEDFITKYARKCTSFYYIKKGSSYSTLEEDKHEVDEVATLVADENNTRYLTLDPKTHIVTYKLNDRDEDGNLIEMPAMSVNGVDKIEFSITKQKLTTENTDKKVFYYLNYKIVMMEGYSLKASVILYNVKNISTDTSEGGYSATYSEDVDASPFIIGGESTDINGIGFIEKK